MNIKLNTKNHKNYDANLLAHRSYYESIISTMQAHGFQFLSWVTMNSSAHEYHVDFHGLSQHSRLFFFLPGKAFFIALELVQHIGKAMYGERGQEINWDPQSYNGHWTARFCLEYDHIRYTGERWQEAVQRIRADGKLSSELDWDDYDYCVDDQCLAPVFQWHTSNQFEAKMYVDHPSALPKADDVVRVFAQIKNDLSAYMYPRLQELDYLDFEMYYCFPQKNWQTGVKTQNRESFWSQFNLKRLRNAKVAWHMDLKLQAA